MKTFIKPLVTALVATAALTSVTAQALPNGCGLGSRCGNGITLNAITGNALTDNALTLNAITGNALTQNALTDNAVADTALDEVVIFAITLPADAAR